VVNDIEHLHRANRLIAELAGDRDIFRASERLRRLAVQVILDPACSGSPALEAALLTIVNAGHRTLLGGVYVVSPPRSATRTLMGMRMELPSAIRALGGQVINAPLEGVPIIAVGGGVPAMRSNVGVRVEVDGWAAGVTPIRESPLPGAPPALPLAGIFGGAIAVSEIFSAALALHPEACERQIGFSLWEPDPSRDWRICSPGPVVRALPSSMWLIGIGHLGQAYLWALSSLPYDVPGDVEIWLQDDDRIGGESKSTGLLVGNEDLGKMKTRVAASRMESAGFRTRIVERRLAGTCSVGEDAPRLILGGVDSPASRLAIAEAVRSDASPRVVIDVGLGAEPTDFDQLVVHSSPLTPHDEQRLRDADGRVRERAQKVAESTVFGAIAEASGLDRCGMFRLAEIAVGVPYVGAAAGAIAVAEILRRLAGARPVKGLSVDLRNLGFGLAPLHHDMLTSRIPFTDALPP